MPRRAGSTASNRSGGGDGATSAGDWRSTGETASPVAAGLPAGGGPETVSSAVAGTSEPATAGLPLDHHRVPPSQSAVPATVAKVSQRRRKREREGRLIAAAKVSRLGGVASPLPESSPRSSTSTRGASPPVDFRTGMSAIGPALEGSRPAATVAESQLGDAAGASGTSAGGEASSVTAATLAVSWMAASIAPTTVVKLSWRSAGSSLRQPSRTGIRRRGKFAGRSASGGEGLVFSLRPRTGFAPAW